MKEKLKAFFDKVNINHIVFVILVMILLMLFYQNKQFEKIIQNQLISNNTTKHYNKHNFDRYIEQNFKTDIDKYFEKINKDFEFELRNMKRNFEENFSYFDNINKQIQDNFEGRRERKRRNFAYYPKTEQTDKEFILRMKLPKNITLEDIKVDLQSNNLLLEINKTLNSNENNVNSYSFSSFFRNFPIKETKATIKDVKVELINGELLIVVPII